MRLFCVNSTVLGVGELKQTIRVFGLFLAACGCHSNAICFMKNSDSLFEFANPENPIVHAKNASIYCTELKYVQFSHILV